VLGTYALPTALRVRLSDFFRRVMKALIASGVKAVPCYGALLGMMRSTQRAWDEPSCQLIPHDDDVDLFYKGTVRTWQAIDWRRFGLVFRDLRAAQEDGAETADFALYDAASKHTKWPFVEFFRPRPPHDTELLKSAVLAPLALWPRPQRPFPCFLPARGVAKAWLQRHYGTLCFEEAVVAEPHLPAAVTRRFRVPPADAVFSVATGELLSASDSELRSSSSRASRGWGPRVAADVVYLV
jgi:hypothetical protein